MLHAGCRGVCTVVYGKSAVVYDLIIISCLDLIGLILRDCCGEGQTVKSKSALNYFVFLYRDFV